MYYLTEIVKSAHVDHLKNMSHKSWLSHSNAVRIAISSAKWNKCFDDNAPLSILLFQNLKYLPGCLQLN